MEASIFYEAEQNLRLLEQIGSLISLVDWNEWKRYDDNRLEELGWFIERTAVEVRHLIEGDEKEDCPEEQTDREESERILNLARGIGSLYDTNINLDRPGLEAIAKLGRIIKADPGKVMDFIKRQEDPGQVEGA